MVQQSNIVLPAHMQETETDFVRSFPARIWNTCIDPDVRRSVALMSINSRGTRLTIDDFKAMLDVIKYMCLASHRQRLLFYIEIWVAPEMGSGHTICFSCSTARHTYGSSGFAASWATRFILL